MDEFALIRLHFAGLTAHADGVVLGIGDDAALLAVPPGQQLAVTTDTLVAGRHFPGATPAFDIGFKALAVNLSDLAAMGAVPRWFTLALTLEAVDGAWLHAFAQGLKTLADAHGVALVGGDTARGPLAITLTAMGLLPPGAALRRDGARAGDWVCVTGTLGDAAQALPWALGESPTPADADAETLLARLNRPTPRVAAGVALRGLASAALDLSDGLAGDLGHLLVASSVGAELTADALPQSIAFARHAPPAQRLALQLHGGDDYELCCCIPPGHLAEAQARLAALGIPLTVVGYITAEPGLRLCQNGGIRPVPAQGYRHF